MRGFKLLFVLLMSSAVLVNCAGPQHDALNAKDSTASKTVNGDSDTSFLSDKNFAYKNLNNTFGLDRNFKYDNDKLYADSTHKIMLTALTPEQERRFVSPFITRELKVDGKYAVDLMQSYFVAKQPKLGDLQPIIVSINGDDYTSLTMILLDKNYRFVDGYNINGGMLPGPEEIGDSITKFELRSYSVINKKEITTIKIDEADFHDSIKRKPSIIDSTVYKTIINAAGKFKTNFVLKRQYKIPYR